MEFRSYLLVEQKKYFSDKVGDVLTGIQNLLDGGKQISLRNLMQYSTEVVNQIRKILHSSWTRAEYKYLKVLQRVGVAISKAIDEKGDLEEILASSAAEVQNVLHKLGYPINKFAEE